VPLISGDVGGGSRGKLGMPAASFLACVLANKAQLPSTASRK
jgi:hypothetical protein